MFTFLGIGAQKAGTSWLYEMLKQHPQIDFPLNKEVHYWNRKYPSTSPDNYLSSFNHNTLAQGEITPAYSFLPLNTISAIHQTQPNLKIIYILRNPIDRAWSSAKMALYRAEMEFHEASNQWFIDHFNSQGSLMRGDYEKSIINWSRIFKPKQLLILYFEDLHQSPKALLNQCCDHLEIPHFPIEVLKTMNTEKIVFSGSPNPLNSVLRSHLKTLYEDKIHSLTSVLNRDLSHWL